MPIVIITTNPANTEVKQLLIDTNMASLLNQKYK